MFTITQLHRPQHTYSEKAAVNKLNQYGMFSYIEVYKIMAYGSTAYVGTAPKKNGGHIKSAQMTRMKCLR